MHPHMHKTQNDGVRKINTCKVYHKIIKCAIRLSSNTIACVLLASVWTEVTMKLLHPHCYYEDVQLGKPSELIWFKSAIF